MASKEVCVTSSESGLSCSLCKNNFKAVKCLPCSHAYCSNCLGEQMIENQNSCPKCETLKQSPDDGTLHSEEDITDETETADVRPGLNLSPKYVTIERHCGICEEQPQVAGRCLDCDDDLCKDCIKYHEKLKVTSSHIILLFQKHLSRAESDDAEHTYVCEKHDREKMRFYCKTCRIPVCRDCVLTTHKAHKTRDLSDEVSGAREEVEKLILKVESKKLSLEEDQDDLNRFKMELLNNVQKVSDVITHIHDDILQRVEQSYHDLMAKLAKTKESEIQRLNQEGEFYSQRILSVSDFISTAESLLLPSNDVGLMMHYDVFRQAAPILCKRVDFARDQAEFLLSKNPKFTKNTAENILGRVSFAVNRSPVEQCPERRLYIREVLLQRQVAFHIWEMHCTKPSVRGITEGTDGLIWVATPRSLLKIGGNGCRKNSIHLTSNIAGITTGLDGKLIVAFSKGNSIKVFFQDVWSNYAVTSDPVSALASTADKRQTFVTQVSSVGTRKLLVFCNQGKDSVEIFLTEGFGDPKTTIPSLAVSASGDIAICDTNKGKLLIFDSAFQLKHEYKGPEDFLYPRCVCYDKYGHLIVADSKRYTVHLVNKDGHFLAFVLTKDDLQDIGSPCAVSVDRTGRLWVGTDMGNVCSYIYMHDVM